MKRLSAVLVLSCACALAQSVPSDEIEAKVHDLSNRDLVRCAEDCRSCPLPDGYCDSNAITSELADRQNVNFLIQAYRQHPRARSVLVVALWRIEDDPKVEEFMRQIAFRGLKPNEPDYAPHFFPLDYLARRCELKALARLNRKVNFEPSYPVGCILWAPAVETFSKCNYRAAAPNLVRALHAACLNITDAALNGLEKFYPGACPMNSTHDIETGEMDRCYSHIIAHPGRTSEHGPTTPH